MRAADISNWTGAITDAQARCLRSRGIELLICGTQAPPLTRQQLAAASAAGLRVEAYVILRWPDGAPSAISIAEQVRAARAAIDGSSVERLWIDCEQYLSIPQPPPQQTRASIHEAVDGCSGIACGIYTARYWWQRATGATREFAARGLPLWDARYVQHDGDAVPPFVPYGGWTRATMTQWHDTTELCGLTVCLDEREEEEGAELSIEEYNELKTAITELRDGEGALLRQAGVLGAKCDAGDRELRHILALLAEGRRAEAMQRLRFEMTAAGEAWPPSVLGQ